MLKILLAQDEKILQMEMSLFIRKNQNKPAGKLTLPDLVKIIRNPEAGGELFSNAATIVNSIRNERDPEKQKELKSHLPCISPGALFGNNRQDVISFTGLMQIDVDYVEQPKKLIHHLSKQKWVTLAALSVRRNVWFLVRIPETDRQPEYWDRVNLWLLKHYYPEADISRQNPRDLRFYAQDPDCFFNPMATTWKTLPPPSPNYITIQRKVSGNHSHYSPFEDYNSRGDVVGLLLSKGWKLNNQTANKIELTRPDKHSGISAIFFKETKLLYVHSSNTQLTPNKPLKPVDVFLELHQVTTKEAYQVLLSMGYGYKKKTAPT